MLERLLPRLPDLSRSLGFDTGAFYYLPHPYPNQILDTTKQNIILDLSKILDEFLFFMADGYHPSKLEGSVMSFEETIKELNTGLPASIIADMLQVTQLSILRCLNTEQRWQPDTKECERLEQLHPILRDASGGQYRSIFRIWKSKGSTGQTLADLCCADELDTAAIADYLNEFAPSIARYTRQDLYVSTPIRLSDGKARSNCGVDLGMSWFEWPR